MGLFYILQQTATLCALVWSGSLLTLILDKSATYITHSKDIDFG
jgi:hypothetical protein